MNQQTLQRYAVDPAAFISDLMDGVGRPLVDHQKQLVSALAPSLLDLRARRIPRRPRFWVEQTKGAGKDTLLAAVSLWLVAFTPWAISGQVGAADQDQAGELRKAALTFTRANAWLDPFVTVLAHKIESPKTGSVVEIIPADAHGSHGAVPDFLILNEICHVQKEDFAQNLADNAAKVVGNVTIVATNAGAETHWSYTWRAIALSSGRWTFLQFAQPAPWISAAELDEAEARNPHSRFRRLFWGEWATGSGDAFEENLIASALTLDGPAPRRPGLSYVLGLDLGVRRDASAAVVVGIDVGWLEEKRLDQPREPINVRAAREVGFLPWKDPNATEEIFHEGTGRIELAAVKVWRPTRGQQVQLADVEAAIVELDREFGLSGVAIDAYQAEFLTQRLNGHGIETLSVPITGKLLNTMANQTLGVFQEKIISLYDDADLLADLRAVRIVEKSYGVRLESPTADVETGTRHGDTLSALQLALLHTRTAVAAAAFSSTKLVLYP